MSKSRGVFITVEGGEGSGKSCLITALSSWMTSSSLPYVVTREPGGTPIGEKIRELFLGANSMGPLTWLLAGHHGLLSWMRYRQKSNSLCRLKSIYRGNYMHLDQLDVAPEISHSLKRLLAGNQPHLMVFTSPNGKEASACAKAWLCDWLGIEKKEHPDLLELSCSGKVSLHTIENIRNLIEQLSLTPFALQRRGVFIDAAERMLPSSSNALLKTLEEPPPHTVIILATEAPHQLLPTILSRAQMIRLPGVPEEFPLPSALHDLLAMDSPTYAHVLRAAETIEEEFEEEKESLIKELREKAVGDEASIDGAVGMAYQRRAARLFEALYLALRHTTSPLLLQQALEAIQRSSDLKNTLTWFLTAAK